MGSIETKQDINSYERIVSMGERPIRELEFYVNKIDHWLDVPGTKYEFDFSIHLKICSVIEKIGLPNILRRFLDQTNLLLKTDFPKEPCTSCEISREVLKVYRLHLKQAIDSVSDLFIYIHQGLIKPTENPSGKTESTVSTFSKRVCAIKELKDKINILQSLSKLPSDFSDKEVVEYLKKAAELAGIPYGQFEEISTMKIAIPCTAPEGEFMIKRAIEALTKKASTESLELAELMCE